jgi:hypothetical protein
MIMPTRATLRPRAWSAPCSASPSGEKQSTSSRHNVYLGRYPIPSLPLTRLVSPKPRHFFLRHGCSLRLPLLGSGRAGASGEGIPEGSGGQDLAPFVMSPACDALCRRIPILPSPYAFMLAEQKLYMTRNREHKLKGPLSQLENQFDWILIDCPPVLGNLTDNALNAARQVVIRAGVGRPLISVGEVCCL